MQRAHKRLPVFRLFEDINVKEDEGVVINLLRLVSLVIACCLI
jgi:hypothetical protein